MWIDTHAHLDMPQFEDEVPEIILRAMHHNVEAIVTVGIDLPSSEKAVTLADAFPPVYAAVGVHPHEAAQLNEETVEAIKTLSDHPKVVAVGEIGLDFYRNLSPPDVQDEAFRRQIRLARELGKPIVVHSRNAHTRTVRVLQEENAWEVGGVIHCFNGSLSMAKSCIDLGFYISVTGSITFKNASRLRNVVINTPRDRLLIETDCPFLAPVPFRGKRNEPSYVRYTGDKTAKILKIPSEELAEQTTRNAVALFGLKLEQPSD